MKPEPRNVTRHAPAHPAPSYTAAIIGLGFVGAGDPVSGEALGQKVANLDGTHAQGLAAHPRVKLVAGASRDEGRRARFTERTGGARTYADWREMLARERPDLVGIATRSPEHAEVVIACAEAGVRAILCEKPITTCLADADHAISACAASGTLLAVNHNRRWNPLWRLAREEIRKGAVGEVQHVFAQWVSGRLGNVGTHFFDAVRFLLGTEARAVSGTLDPDLAPDCRGPGYRDPGGWGIVVFDGGVKLFVDATQASKLPPRVRVVGSLGQMAIHRDHAVLEPWEGAPTTLTSPAGRKTSVALAVEDLVNCLERAGQPAATGEDARAALEIILGFHVSDRLRGQWVPLPLTGENRTLEVRIG